MVYRGKDRSRLQFRRYAPAGIKQEICPDCPAWWVRVIYHYGRRWWSWQFHMSMQRKVELRIRCGNKRDKVENLAWCLCIWWKCIKRLLSEAWKASWTDGDGCRWYFWYDCDPAGLLWIPMWFYKRKTDLRVLSKIIEVVRTKRTVGIRL